MRQPCNMKGLARCVALGSFGLLLAPTVSIAPPSAALPSNTKEVALNAASYEPEDAGVISMMSTETTTTTREVDGSLTLTSYGYPVNYRDAAGDWQEIDDELVPAPGARFVAQNAANNYLVQIPEDASTTPVKFWVGTDWVTMKMDGLEGSPSVAGSTATYSDVEKASEVTYESVGTGLKESIVLTHPPTGDLSFGYTMRTSAGIHATVLDTGAIALGRPDETPVAVIPPGVMWDASDRVRTSDAVQYELEQVGAEYRLTVTPDLSWLLSPATTYPVVVDPTVSTSPLVRDCWIRSDVPTQSACGAGSIYIKAGRTTNGGKYRGLLDFDTDAIPVASIVNTANVALYLDSTATIGGVVADYAFRTTGKKFDINATWSSSGAAGGWTGGSEQGSATSPLSLGGGTTGWKTFNGLGPIVQAWVDDSESRTGLLLRQNSETTNTLLHFVSSSSQNSPTQRPVLTVNYSLNPDSPSDDPLPPTTTSSGLDEYEFEDVQGFALEEGISTPQAVAKYSWTDAFNADVATIAADFSDIFVSSESNPVASAQPSAVIRLTTAAPAAVQALVADLPVTPTFEVVNALTAEELIDWMSSALDGVKTATGADVQATARANADHTGVVVEYFDPNSSSTTQQAGTASRQRVASDNSVTLPDVEVLEADTPFIELNTLYGGQPIGGSGGYVCTSAFPARVIGSSVDGMLTAFHCNQFDTRFVAPADHRPRRAYQAPDRATDPGLGEIMFQARRTDRTEPLGRSFFNSPTHLRRITGVTTRGPGQKVCMFGRRTLMKNCGIVPKEDTMMMSHPIYPENVLVHNVYGRLSDHGDSGGPVFIGGKAVGVIGGATLVTPPRHGGEAEDPYWVSFYSSLEGISRPLDEGGLNVRVNF